MRPRLVLFASACPWISSLATDEWALGMLAGRLEDAKQSAISACQRRYPGHHGAQRTSRARWSGSRRSGGPYSRTYSAVRFALAMIEFP
jgi:hypothetical protein